MNRILIAEDEPRIVSFLEKGLQAHGYTTTHSDDASEVLQMACSDTFDLLILDLGLPNKDGLEILEILRGQGENLPIIILSARNDLHDKVFGLEKGADDYVTKPFHFDELLARIRARLRHHILLSQQTKPHCLQVGGIRIDLHTREVWVDDHKIDLSAREFVMVEIFVRHPGQVLSRTQLLDHVWGYDYDPGSNIVDVYVGYLRKKIGKSFFETIRGVGYRLNTEAKCIVSSEDL